MRIAVAHHSLNAAGGAERLCLATIEALKTRGHEVSLVTVERTDWTLLQDKFGQTIMPDREIYITSQPLSQKLKSIPIASTYFLAYTIQLLINRSKNKHDLTINTFGDAIYSIADIAYIHFPLRAASEFSQIPAFTYASIWRTLAPLYNLATSACDKIAPSRILLTNSKFMQEIVKASLHRIPIVVYPPVDTETFSRCSKARKDDSLVAIVASYAPKRHLEQVPLIAKHAKNARFVVIGKTDGYSAPTLENLKDRITALGVEDRVILLKNVPFEELLEVLSKAKVYLHVMPYDHFGISVVEAMASGCVPVVHRSGGPWTDILEEEQGICGFSYLNATEAANQIDNLILDENLRSTVAAKASYRAKKFDKPVFMRRLREVVEKVAA